MMPPNEIASTSEGGLHSIIFTVNDHSDNEPIKECNRPIELQCSKNEETLQRTEDRLAANHRPYRFWSCVKKFFQMIIVDGSRSVILLLFGIICALLSGCCLSSTIVFTGRIKHVLLTDEARTETFRIRTYEQVYILASLTMFAVVANFCLHMASNFFVNKVSESLKKKYADTPKKISNNRHLQKHISNELIEKIRQIRNGSENLELFCRSIAIVISSSFISFYHEFRLTFVLLAVIPICIGIHFLSEKLSRLLNDIRRSKAARAADIEKELLLLNGIDERSSTDERLVRLSDELYSATRYGIMKEAWDGFYSGIICFIVFTAVGCGMLYGGYLLEVNVMVKQGDIFIVVLSMALLANTTSAITSQWKALTNGVDAAVYVSNLEGLQLDKVSSASFQRTLNSNEITVTNLLPTSTITVASKISPEYAYSQSNQKVAFFMSSTNKILKNNYHDRLYMALGFLFAAVHGLELPAYNLIMGRVFMAMLEPRIGMMHKLLHTMIMFTCVGFLVLLIRTISGAFSGIASEHVFVSFRINLARHHIRPRTACGKRDVEELLKEHTLTAANAKSFYHPFTSQLISHVTSVLANIILGFVFSWEIALLGTLFTLLCLIVQLKIGDSMERDRHAKHIQKKSKGQKHSEEQQNDIAGNTLLAINFSLMQTADFVIQTVCYALTAYIVNNGYKHVNEAFVSVIMALGALQHVILFPTLFNLFAQSCSSAHQIFTLMYLRPSPSKYAKQTFGTSNEKQIIGEPGDNMRLVVRRQYVIAM
ncbi:hypothetical protein Tcan_05127 [Toxocara canis]|uniref:ABC transmembrane type-1 domain-containing protein n=1 Tax=Toxocara canis TaxID=6265 RepID=A0A0B2VAA5_TOXCA|nr:hypothetical protein Tcan_05127 [Toxocara canis]